MGEIADMLIDGTLDFYTGEYLGLGKGIPRTKDKSLSWEKKDFKKNGQAAINGVKKSLYNKLRIRDIDSVKAIVNEYMPGEGTLKVKCLKIQNEWPKFCQWVNEKIKEANNGN